MRELVKRFGRAALFAWIGTSWWAGAVGPAQIIPAQATPGERVAVQLEVIPGGPAGNCQTPVTIAIGSVRVPEYECDDQNGLWYVFNVPGNLDAPMPGPQRLEVLRPGQVLPPRVVREQPNFEVLPKGDGVVVAASPAVLEQLRRDGELDLSLLGERADLSSFPRTLPPNFTNYLAPQLERLKNTRLRLPILPPRQFQLPSNLPGLREDVPYPFLPNRVLPQELPRGPIVRVPVGALERTLGYGLTFPRQPAPPMLNPRTTYSLVPALPPMPVASRVIAEVGSAVRMCGAERYGQDDFPAPLGLVIELARRTYRDTGGLLIAPSTGPHPPHTTQNAAGPYATPPQRLAAQGTAMRAIGTMTQVSGALQRAPGLGTGKGVHIFLIDTLAALSPVEDTQAGVDAGPLHVETLWEKKYFSQGHGIAAWALLTDPRFGVAPGVTIHPVAACGPDGRCLMDTVIRGLCAAKTFHQTTGAPVIVNLSVTTPYNHPLLRQALQEVTEAGVAVVAAYGNDDRCALARGKADAQDRCNAYPADWTRRTETQPALNLLYSVGAREVGAEANPWRAVQPFQRGSTSGATVATQPTVYAPAFFWLEVGRVPAFSNSPTIEQSEWTEILRRSRLRPFKGTSFAAPIVTGALALWRAKHLSEPVWPALKDNLCVLQLNDPAICPSPLLP